jgi:fido (protein-threonine AMPylation protein)
MLDQIDSMRHVFDSLPKAVKDLITPIVRNGEAVAFVLNSNRLELVGTQDEAETRELCELAARGAADASGASISCDKRRETTRTFEALQHMHRLKSDMCEGAFPQTHALFLTPDIIKEVHEALTQGLVAAPGQYRQKPVYPEGYAFVYTHPDAIENAMFSWTDQINWLLHSFSQDVSLEDVFKLAALTLFYCVDVHPFSDGNGRLCRIVTNSMLMLHHFFPVYIQPVTADGIRNQKAWRAIYIAAIEQCRRHAQKVPEDLTALLIESSWTSWNRITEMLREWVVDGSLLVGRIFVGANSNDAANIRAHVAQRHKSLYHGRRPALEPVDAQAEIDKIASEISILEPRAWHYIKLQDGCVVAVCRP